MKLNMTQIGIIVTIIVGVGALALLVSQKSGDIEAKYREVVDVFGLAREIGLDIDQFKKDIDSEDVHKVVEADKKEGDIVMGSQTSTPTILINEERFSQGATVDELVANIKTNIETKLAEQPEEKVTLTEFFDFNCIHCANIEEALNDMVEEFGDKVVYSKKYYPFLRSSSTTYAYAGEAAKRQGKLIEFSELLFSKIHGI